MLADIRLPGKAAASVKFAISDGSCSPGQPRLDRNEPMIAVYRYLFPTLWLAWLLYWWISAAGTKTTVRRESLPSRLSYIAPLGAAVWLLAAPRMPAALARLNEGFVPRTAVTFWLGAAITMVGLLFTIWARVHLGRNWSGTVTIKQGHELVTSGPYSLVRHPIYTGLLLAFIGSAIGLGEWRGIVGIVIAAASFWIKLRIEENWLQQEFGETYAAYRQRVRALVPYIL